MQIQIEPLPVDTVLVLGAGASCHLGYPIGSSLCEEIIRNTDNKNLDAHAKFIEMGFSAGEIEAFHIALKTGLTNTIDELLAANIDLIPIGRAAIAQALIQHENFEKLYGRQSNWFTLLAGAVKAGLTKNNLSMAIVTFNYDRSVDQALQSSCEPVCSKLGLSSYLEDYLPILHVHGRLGYLPHQKAEGIKRSYSSDVSIEQILSASKNIKVPCELESDYGDEMLLAQKLIAQAKKVILLGFGYDQVNLFRLRIVDPFVGQCWPGDNKYFGTGYRLRQSDRLKLAEQSVQRLTVGHYDHDTYSFLYRNAYLE